MKCLPLAVLSLSILSSSAFASTTVTRQPVLTYAQARSVADKAENIIKEHHLGGVIAVVDNAGLPIIIERLDGATLANSELAPKKAHSAAAFGVPTSTFQQKIAAGNVGMLGNPAVIPLPGGEPLSLDGVVVGAIGVSTPDGNVDSEASKAAASTLTAG